MLLLPLKQWKNLIQVIVYGTNAHTVVKNWLNSDLGGTWVEQSNGFYKR